MSIDGVKGFSFNQLNKIVDIMNSSASKTKEEVIDSVALGSTRTLQQDVIIMPDVKVMKGHFSVKDMTSRVKEEGIALKDNLELINGVTAKVTPEEIDKLQKQGFVVYDDSPRDLSPGIPAATASTTRAGNSWDMPEIKDIEWTGAKDLHAQGLTGKGRTIAIVDSGYNHPAKPLKAWVDVVEKSPKPIDPNGHGTHVAGDANKIAPDAELVGIRVMNSQGQGRPSDIVKGIEWAIKNKDRFGIDIINMSLGAGPDGVPFHMDPINKAVEQAIKLGMDVVAAAGNSGPGAETIGSPADDPAVLTVAAALNPNKVSDFSSRGLTEDGLVKPDITAPGEFITSWAAPNSQLDNIGKTIQTIRDMTPDQLTTLFTNKPDLIQALGLPSNVMSLSAKEREKVVKTHLPPMFKPTADTLAGPGTSFASPEMAGLAALLKQAVPNSTPADRKEAFMKTADSMGSNYKPVDQGAGFVDADEAVKYLKENK